MKSKDEQLIEAVEKFCEKYNHGVRDSIIEAIIGFYKDYHAKSVYLSEIKHDFFKEFGQYSFRGYTQEQCHSIFNFFLPHIQPSNEDCLNKQLTDWSTVEFGKWKSKNVKDIFYPTNSDGTDDLNMKTYVLNLPETSSDNGYRNESELYEEFLKSKTK